MFKSQVSLFALLAASMTPLAMAGPAYAQKTVVQDPPGAMTNKDWWPQSLDLAALRQHEAQSNPYGADYDYAAEFATLDLDAVKEDIRKVLTTSQDWWPADYGHYGPFFIRMAWHSAGNVSLEEMGFKTIGFAGGRVDAWQPDLVFWGPEAKMLADNRRDGKGNLKGPLAATQMGLIYVNPEGPNGNHDPISAAADIRRAFGNMAMNDEETLALIAGGHTFGKAHGAHKPEECMGAEPSAAGVEAQGMGWANKCGKGNAEDTITSGLEGAWSANPIAFTSQYLDNLFGFEWVKTKSPAGATQWIPSDPNAANLVPDAHIPGKTHAPIMFTTDIAIKEDPGFRKIAERWHENPDEFAAAFARAWFKLTHRDLGPSGRYLGKDVPSQSFLWQDPLPAADYAMIGDADVSQLKSKILASGLTTPELVRTAWASASTYRSSDMRGGANGARLRLAPQRDWSVNAKAELDKVLGTL